jgi:hypothetical protein
MGGRMGFKMHLSIPVLGLLALVAGVPIAPPLHAQTPPDSVAQPESADVLAEGRTSGGLPIFGMVGFGYGSRMGECVLCASPEDDKSFIGHVTLGRPLGAGFGVGLDSSVWIRRRPGTPGPEDDSGVPQATNLTNAIGNTSVSISYDVWHVFLRAGFGLAWGRQDLEFENSKGEMAVHTASGMGVGYSAGAGFTVPLASAVSLAIFGNWSVGRYDMVSHLGLTERDARHEWFELGVGAAIR